jgi:5-methylcytosine-specific restriction endonuclease McrA
MNINKNCEWCGQLFATELKHINKGGGKFCSRQCSTNRKKKPVFEKGCKKCGKIFYHNKNIFCSKKCSNSVSRKIRNDIIGKIFGKLTVLEFLGNKERSEKYHKPLRLYRCLCECGIMCEKFGVDLRSKNVISCGCYKHQILKEIHTGRISPQRNIDGASNKTAKDIWKKTYSDGISFDDFFRLSQLCCHYCGEQPSNKCNTINKKSCSKNWYDQGWWQYNGLDRVDSTLNHSLDNVVPSCWRCNKAKGIMGTTEFMNWIHQVYNHNHSKQI